MTQSKVVIFFPEMHQNSPTAIKDFKNFSRGDTPRHPLWKSGKERGGRGTKGGKARGRGVGKKGRGDERRAP